MSVPHPPVRDYFAQFGEDRILARIFADKAVGTCVEVGANNGYDGSATLYFEQRGWACVLVEPNPELCAVLRATRRGRIFECGASNENGSAVLQLAEGADLAHAVSTLEQGDDAAETLRRHGVATRPVEVAIRRLDDILNEAGIGDIDFVTIDVEGHELSVLRGFTLGRWRPAILIVEDNSQARDRAVRDHLRAEGYVPFRRTGVNDWFCRSDDRRFAGIARRPRYLASLGAARLDLAIAPYKGRLARVPGVLAAVRMARSLRG